MAWASGPKSTPWAAGPARLCLQGLLLGPCSVDELKSYPGDSLSGWAARWEGGCLGRWSEVHTLVFGSRGQGLVEKLLPKRRIVVLAALACYIDALGFRLGPDWRAGAARRQEGDA